MEINRLKDLVIKFEIKDLGALRYYLVIEVAWSKRGLVVSQQKYLLDLLEEIGISGCRSFETLMDPNVKLWDKGERVFVDTRRY